MKLKCQVVTKKSNLNVRSGPGTNYKIVGKLKKGQTFTATKLQNNFYYMGSGWCCKSYTKVLQNLESAPSTSPKPTTPPPAKPANPPDTTLDRLGGYLKPEYDPDKSNIVGDVTFSSEAGYDAMTMKTIVNNKNFPTLVAKRPGDDIYDYRIDTSWQDANIKILKRNLNMYEKMAYASTFTRYFHHFDRFKMPYPEMSLGKTFAHVFFTRPDLNIVNRSGMNFSLTRQAQNDPLYYHLGKSRLVLLASLTSTLCTSHDLIPYLSNAASSFEISDEFIKTVEHGETWTGHKIQYGKNDVESKSAGTFSVTYTDDRELSVYKMHKVWVDYISKVYRGAFEAKEQHVKDRALDYASSVYYILCAEDGETILFWSKFYGVFPTNAPSSATSWSKGNLLAKPEFSVNYAYSFKEDFNPYALAEFNFNCRGGYTYKKVYEPELASTGKSFSGAPFIDTVTDSTGNYVYKLRFRTLPEKRSDYV